MEGRNEHACWFFFVLLSYLWDFTLEIVIIIAESKWCGNFIQKEVGNDFLEVWRGLKNLKKYFFDA
jgi:hypothetical protein